MNSILKKTIELKNVRDTGFGCTVSNYHSAATLSLYQLKETSSKLWMSVFFNYRQVNYIEWKLSLMPCKAGSVNFFVDLYAEVLPCHGMEEQVRMESNIRKVDHYADCGQIYG